MFRLCRAALCSSFALGSCLREFQHTDFASESSKPNACGGRSGMNASVCVQLGIFVT
jgi:hypothetical protein